MHNNPTASCVIEHRTIQYIMAKHPMIHDRLKQQGMNKVHNLFFTVELTTKIPIARKIMVFMIIPNGSMFRLKECKPDEDFMEPMENPDLLHEVIELARYAVMANQRYLLPHLNTIERSLGLPETRLWFANASHQITPPPLF